MKFSSKPWWMTDDYSEDTVLGPLEDPSLDVWGPRGPAFVELYTDGKTSTGWGRDTFMDNYMKNRFNTRRMLYGYNKGKWNVALVVRSARLVCIDIDGKNGGFDHASELGFLPPTAAETSKSGNGYHLFYETEQEWDPVEGFHEYRDHIGIVDGVDVRGTGCVYHYPTQRWNTRSVAKLPVHLKDKLLQKHQQIANRSVLIQKTLQLDPEEIALMHDNLIEELNKPIAVGKRNNSLFAIGTKLKEAEVENWDALLHKRGAQVGLDYDEVAKIVSNVENYG